MAKRTEELKDIEERLDKLKNQEGKVTNQSYPNSSFANAASIGFRIAVELTSGIVIGAAIGYLLDNIFHTKPLFLSVLLIFGGAAGFLNVYRFAKEEEKKRNKE